MKKFVPIIIILCTFLLLAGCSVVPVKPTEETSNTPADTAETSTYTYDGEYDPAVFFSWDVVRISNCPAGHYHFFLMNPDKDSDTPMVETVNILRDNGKYTLIGYRYLKNGVKHVFTLDMKRDHYTRQKTDKPGGI